MEADEDESGLEEDSSDDEDDPLVPRDWDSYNFSQLSVNPCENMSWEYRDNTVSIGAMYKSVVEVKDAVKRWATLTLKKSSG
jgi:hypothetical protein